MVAKNKWETPELGFNFRKRADKSGGEAVRMADLPGSPPGTYPLAGVEFIGDPPDKSQLTTNKVQEGIAEGWITAEGHEVITRPAGPPGEPWRPTINAPTPHIFHHYQFLTVCGVKYKVVHQPDKYADHGQATPGLNDDLAEFDGDDDTPVSEEIYDAGATRVDWFYGLERVKGK